MRTSSFASLSFASLAVAFGFTQIASAADMPVKAPVVRPAPVVVAPWTGCYVGANVGYGWSPTRWYDPPTGVEFAHHTADGVVGGGQVGCDYQVQNWVFGIQGMFDGAGLKGSSTNLFLDSTGQTIDETKVSWFATLTGRVGYTIQPMTLLYVKGGFAWVRSKYTECCEFIPPVPPGPPIFTDFLEDGVASVTRTGWTVGGGVEHMFAPNWSVFAEYNYIGLGTDSITFQPLAPATTPFAYNIKQNVQTVLIGVNYRWGGIR
jgi:outer membrane immunogenic protein